MGAAVWEGLVRFGLISIPVKLYRAAKAEKISFRQLHKSSGARIRQQLCTDIEPEVAIPATHITADAETWPAKPNPSSHAHTLSLHTPSQSIPRALSRDDVAKGYQYGKDQYVVVSREDLAQLVPSTASETTISEFVQPAEIDVTYLDSTFYVVPNRSTDRGYALLFQALARTGLAGLAQITMHSRESVVILRACGCRMIAQTLFYDAEIRREREYRADTPAVGGKELDVAVRLIENLRVPFEPMKYFDRYREGLQRLVRTRVAAHNPSAACNDEPTGVTPLLEVLQRSLKRAVRNSPTAESGLVNNRRRTGKRRRALAS